MKKLFPSGRSSRSDTSVSESRGRPLSYSPETDSNIAQWVRNQTDKGIPVTNSELRKHAKEIVIKENPSFTASASWAQNFLHRHKLSLHPNTHSDKKSTNARQAHASSSPASSAALQLPQISSDLKMSSSLDTITAIASSSAPSIFTGATSLSTSAVAADDPVTSTLALLASDTGDPGQLTQSQAAALATLTELTGDAASLVDLLNSAQEAASAENNMAFAQASLDSGSSQLYLPDLMVPTSSVTAQGQQSQQILPPPFPPAEGEVVHTCCRPLSYTKETDNALAFWVKEQQAAGRKVTFASLRSYAKKAVSNENPNFNASVGWVTPFLLRHNLDLKVNDKRRPTRKTTTPRKLQARGEELLGNDDEPGPSDVSIELDTSNANSMLNSPAVMAAENILTTEQLAQNLIAMDTSNPPLQTSTGDEFLAPKAKKRPRPPSARTRHTLAEKLEVVRLMKQYNLAGHYVCRMLGIANSTIAGWVKLVDQKGAELEALSLNGKRSNRSGQGRPLSYSRDKDEALAHWVTQQQEMGTQVAVADLNKQATALIADENPNFIASVGWRHKFLQRHGLQLSKTDKNSPQEEQHSIPIAVQTEEVCTDEFNPESESLDKLYPDQLDPQLVEWVQDKISRKGNLSVTALCQKAEEVITPINPMFVATIGWAMKFLYRHNLFLDPKPFSPDIQRRRLAEGLDSFSAKRMQINPSAIVQGESSNTVSPSTGNLCEALLALSNTEIASQEELKRAQEAAMEERNQTYFGKPAREFTAEEKEEVVRYANATTLQKAAIKYGVAAPTVWRWRMELKLHQPKYTPMQKKYIIKCAEKRTLKDAAQRFGISTKTVQNWRRALQTDGTLTDDHMVPPPGSLEDQTEVEMIATSAQAAATGLITEEVIPMDNSPFEYIVDGGEVTEATRVQEQDAATMTTSTPLEVTHEIQVQDVGMEYDVVSSEGHAAKPRCTPQEKLHILQYALNHSIKEASQKFGISPGTLYYWKKNLMNNNNKKGTGAGNSNGASTSSAEGVGFPLMASSGLETAVVSVPIPPDVSVMASSSSSMMQSTPITVEAIQALASTMEASVLPQSLTDPLGTQSAASNNELIQAITQTLASATPEQLQSLQQITSDLNLLQAVTSIVATQEGGMGQVRQTPGERHDSTGGGISSPTDVLVSFQPSADHTEEVQTSTETVHHEEPVTTVEAMETQPVVDNPPEPEAVHEVIQIESSS